MMCSSQLCGIFCYLNHASSFTGSDSLLPSNTVRCVLDSSSTAPHHCSCWCCCREGRRCPALLQLLQPPLPHHQVVESPSGASACRKSFSTARPVLGGWQWQQQQRHWRHLRAVGPAPPTLVLLLSRHQHPHLLHLRLLWWSWRRWSLRGCEPASAAAVDAAAAASCCCCYRCEHQSMPACWAMIHTLRTHGQLQTDQQCTHTHILRS